MKDLKYPCGVIRDIIPLYKDEVCSAESREAVEEHVAECADCARLFRDMEELPVAAPGLEERKAASYRAVRSRLKHGEFAAVVLAVVLAVTAFIGAIVGGIAIMSKNKRAIEYKDGNITVSMQAEGLVAKVKGARYSGAHVKTVLTEVNGEEKRLSIFRLEESGWDALVTHKSSICEFTIAYAEQSADEVDAVYYCEGKLNEGRLRGMESLPPEELAEILGELVLLWEK